MENLKKWKIFVTALLSVIEGAIGYVLVENNAVIIEGYFVSFFSYVTPVGFLCFLNYYVLSPIIVFVGMEIWTFSGHYRRVSRQFNRISEKCAIWLRNTKTHWGPLDISNNIQNANTCEGLLAMKKSGLSRKYRGVYEEALRNVLNNVTDRGLPSKSLNHETVVCTSMILLEFSIERKSNKKIRNLDAKFRKISETLWSVRCRNGWGVYVDKASESDCSIANTFWAIRALNEYPISKTDGFAEFVRRIYEFSIDSSFGFIPGDIERLCTTAMSVVVYYNLEETRRKMVQEVYNIKKAVDTVFKMFCHRDIECELEVLRGLEMKNHGAKKAPWTHVTVGFATEALVSAYKNGDMSLLKMNELVFHLRRMCKKRLTYINGNNQQCYYMPRGMEIDSKGIFSFPTAYMIWALSAFDF